MGKVKIFVVYHKPMPLYRTDCLEPIQTGCVANQKIDGILHDDDGDNISQKNPYFAELTANYWVWKNYLPANPEVEYVGFCHYRRFIDFWSRPTGKTVFPCKRSYEWMTNVVSSRYSEANVLSAIGAYDIVVPNRVSLGVLRYGLDIKTILQQYVESGHPESAMLAACDAIKRLCPDYAEDVDSYVYGKSGFFCLNYVMRRELFERYVEWTFRIVDGIGDIEYWRQFDNLKDKRIPALVMERMFNVWLGHEMRVNHVKVRERNGMLLDWSENLTLKIRLRKKFSWIVGMAISCFGRLTGKSKHD